jgi:hypothetical protein
VSAEPAHIAALRARLAAAQDEVSRLEFADGYCMTNGSWSRAMNVVRTYQTALVEALAQQIVTDCQTTAANLREIAS